MKVTVSLNRYLGNLSLMGVGMLWAGYLLGRWHHRGSYALLGLLSLAFGCFIIVNWMRGQGKDHDW